MKLNETAVVLNEIAQELSDEQKDNERWIDALLTASRFFKHDPREWVSVAVFVLSVLAIVAGLVCLFVGVVQGFVGTETASSSFLFASSMLWALALVLVKLSEKR